MDYTWEEYQQFVEGGNFKIEDQYDKLIMYGYYDTLQLGYRYAIVLRNNIIMISEDYPYDEWYGAESVLKILKEDKND